MVKERGAQAPLVSETIHAQVRDAAKRNKALGDAAAYMRQKDDRKREPEKKPDTPKPTKPKPTKTKRTETQKRTETPKSTETPKRDASKPHPLQRPNDPKATPTKNAPEVIQNTEKVETKHAPAKRVSGNNAFDTPMWELMFGDFQSRETRYAKNKSTRKDGKVR